MVKQTTRLIACGMLWSCLAAVASAQTPKVYSYTVPDGVDGLPPPPDLLGPTGGNSLPLPPLPPLPPASPMPLTPPPLTPPMTFAESVNSPSDTAIEVEPVVQAPRWYSPWYWVPRDGWNNSFEVGLNGSEGNSQSLSFMTAAKLNRKTKEHNLAIDLNHRRTSANSVETQNNAFFGIDYDRLLGDSRWTWFVKQGLEYDEFRAFDLRLNLNSGLGYYWIRDEASSFITRFGAGTSREFGGTDDEWKPEAVFGVESSHQINARNKIYAKLDYFPQWDRFSDYRMNSDIGWEMLLDDTNNLSLKMAATNRHDSTPLGRKAADLNYSLILIYKF